MSGAVAPTSHFGFPMLVVLFILLIIIGTAYVC
ncbi:YjcZ family sporulation protein [Halalkalibacter akibai]